MPLSTRHLIRSGALAIAALAMAPLASQFALPAASAWAAARPVASLADIRRLAAEAYMWGLGPEFTWRFATYNTTISAPMNALTYGVSPAAWNNSATNAGDSSVIYINGFMDFSAGAELVLTVPPSRNQYYVVNYLDDFINTIGSIGTRTTPSDADTSYLLVGPGSRYAGQKTARIGGRVLPVMASDTNLNWMLIRILTSTLADGTSPDSTPSVYENVSKKFALNTLAEFRANGFKPVYPADYSNPPPTDEEIARAAPYKDTPAEAVRFLDQLGQSLVKSPIPRLNTALGGTPLRRLPAYVVPQYGARTLYLPPSFGQQQTLQRFAKIGLTAKGFKVPQGWGAPQLAALQQGYEDGQKALAAAIAGQAPDATTNYWTLLNDLIGTYPNTPEGYLVRSTIVLNGGSANIPLDAVYPSMTSYNGTDLLDGNSNYTITFTPAQLGAPLPVTGIYPPQVTDGEGKIRGFWSVTVYQPDASEVAAPFLTQAAVLNNAYSSAGSEVLSVDPTADTITVTAPDWGKLIASTPILFDGSAAAGCGLAPKSANGVYFVAADPVEGTGPGGVTTYTFPLSTQWKQEISADKVPIQYSGAAGATVDLTCNSGSNLDWGMLKPVSQLGSSELEDGKLVKNPDGSLTIFIGPTPPADAAKLPNWIPTPSTAYYDGIYGAGSDLSTTLQVILRSYYPTPGDQPPSMLPYVAGNLPESYIPPAIVPAGLCGSAPQGTGAAGVIANGC
ncbi:hypothetical protein DK847_20185 [Aestuariivirga litoralis]|uniref:DUF1254 domain-containing protein n=1 Tax=Aestuariivirga litoralis TaxID=2650924 RepID=A0A2W2AHT2_9HYPH|nr:DUF1254 domain-containing protein [Aestuariivirga litoralis]PZF75055.1 hypothetical protein DK847_20185 [Aestuariivirga litoralis]